MKAAAGGGFNGLGNSPFSMMRFCRRRGSSTGLAASSAAE
jgi:hypothetical protein